MAFTCMCHVNISFPYLALQGRVARSSIILNPGLTAMATYNFLNFFLRFLNSLYFQSFIHSSLPYFLLSFLPSVSAPVSQSVRQLVSQSFIFIYYYYFFSGLKPGGSRSLVLTGSMAALMEVKLLNHLSWIQSSFIRKAQARVLRQAHQRGP